MPAFDVPDRFRLRGDDGFFLSSATSDASPSSLSSVYVRKDSKCDVTYDSSSGNGLVHRERAFSAELDGELADWLGELHADGYLFAVNDEVEEESWWRWDEDDMSTSLPQQQHHVVHPQGAPASPTTKLIDIMLDAGMTSLDVFTSFAKTVVGEDGEVVYDCRPILSRACYDKWLETRQTKPAHPEECFRKSIISHITCSDGGSSPFPKEIEHGLLQLARKRQVWECFRGKKDTVTGRPVQIGIKGLRSLGFHEKQEIERQGISVKDLKRKRGSLAPLLQLQEQPEQQPTSKRKMMGGEEQELVAIKFEPSDLSIK